LASNNTKIVTIPIENTPGTLAEATRVLADENVNIVAIETTSFGEIGLARIVTDKPEAAERALRTKGYTVTTSELVEAELQNKPGELAKLCEKLGEADINIEGLWAGPVTGNTGRIVIRVNDAAAARRVVQSASPKVVSR